MTFGEQLSGVRERYAFWLSLDEEQVDEDRQEDPEEIRAIQIVIRLERDTTPSHRRALELAGAGCALLCLDERSAPGGEWHDAVVDYCHGHIRKVTRRARGKAWTDVADLPGITLRDDATDTEIRVFAPGRVVDLDKRIGRLQVSGTDLGRDETPAPAAPNGPLLTCAVPVDLGMTTGKLMAQAGHAGMTAAALASATDPELLREWYDAGCPTRVEGMDEGTWADLVTRMDDPAAAWRTDGLLAIRDGGFTEVAPGTVTVVGRFHRA